MKVRPKAELLTLGTEIVTGTVVNSNAAFLGRELTELGFLVLWQTACRDEFQEIQASLHQALDRADLVIVTGGLGPTPDDITRECIADFFKVPLSFSAHQFRLIKKQYRERGKNVPAIVRREAMFPAGAAPLYNLSGIALGFLMEVGERLLVALPGVPGEVLRLFESGVRPFLRRRYPGLQAAYRLVIKTIGLSEPTVMKRLGKDFFKLGSFQFGIYPEIGEVSIRIYSDERQAIRRLRKAAHLALKKDVYSWEDVTFFEVLGQILRKKRLTVACAESCTGGALSQQITSIPGSSDYFRGGLVAYHDSVKETVLGVSSRLISTQGAVSPAVAKEMACSIRVCFGADLGISITGVAGPSGGTTEKPVGTVCMGLDSQHETISWTEKFSGNRAQIQARAAKKSGELLWRWLNE